MCYSEHYMEFTAGGQWYCKLNGVCHSEHYTEFTAGGQWYCNLNGVCYSEHYVKDTAHQVDRCIAASMECVTVNIILKIIHSRWTVELWLELIMLQ